MVEVSDACIGVSIVAYAREVELPFNIGYSVLLIVSIRLLYINRSSSCGLFSSCLEGDGCGRRKNGIVITADDERAVLRRDLL